jgi:hypothetical protein
MSFFNSLQEIESMNTLFRSRKRVVLLIALLLFTVSSCASHTKVIKKVYSSHPGGQGHPWDKGRSF